MNEADYTRITHDLTVSVAEAIAARNPKATYVCWRWPVAAAVHSGSEQPGDERPQSLMAGRIARASSCRKPVA
jgi:hypothetical protein